MHITWKVLIFYFKIWKCHTYGGVGNFPTLPNNGMNHFVHSWLYFQKYLFPLSSLDTSKLKEVLMCLSDNEELQKDFLEILWGILCSSLQLPTLYFIACIEFNLILIESKHITNSWNLWNFQDRFEIFNFCQLKQGLINFFRDFEVAWDPIRNAESLTIHWNLIYPALCCNTSSLCLQCG